MNRVIEEVKKLKTEIDQLSESFDNSIQDLSKKDILTEQIKQQPNQTKIKPKFQ